MGCAKCLTLPLLEKVLTMRNGTHWYAVLKAVNSTLPYSVNKELHDCSLIPNPSHMTWEWGHRLFGTCANTSMCPQSITLYSLFYLLFLPPSLSSLPSLPPSLPPSLSSLSTSSLHLFFSPSPLSLPPFLPAGLPLCRSNCRKASRVWHHPNLCCGTICQTILWCKKARLQIEFREAGESVVSSSSPISRPGSLSVKKLPTAEPLCSSFVGRKLL